jgi:hypothetical protein
VTAARMNFMRAVYLPLQGKVQRAKVQMAKW